MAESYEPGGDDWSWIDEPMVRCNFAWPAAPEWGAREHECDLPVGHDGEHVCGWCLACEYETAKAPNRTAGASEEGTR